MVQRRVAVVAAVVVLVGSFVSLAGWGLGMLGLAGVVPGWRAVNPNASLVLLLLASGLLLRVLTRSRAARALIVALALVAAGIGSAAVSAYLGGPGAGLDSLLFRDMTAPGTAPRMAPQAAVGTVFLALALLLSRAATTRDARFFLTCAALPMLLGATAMIGQLYGADPLYQPLDTRATAPFAAVGLQLLAVGLVVAWMPPRFWELLTAPIPTAIVLRRVLPASLLILTGVGYAALRAAQAGLFDRETEAAVIVVGSGFVLTVLLVWVGMQLNRSILETTRARRRADAATAAMHARALELNEEVVQKLSVAWLAHESGDAQLAHRSVQESLHQAQRITRQLLEADREAVPQPGEFRRPSRPSRLDSTADL